MKNDQSPLLGRHGPGVEHHHGSRVRQRGPPVTSRRERKTSGLREHTVVGGLDGPRRDPPVTGPTVAGRRARSRPSVGVLVSTPKPSTTTVLVPQSTSTGHPEPPLPHNTGVTISLPQGQRSKESRVHRTTGHLDLAGPGSEGGKTHSQRIRPSTCVLTEPRTDSVDGLPSPR